MPLSGGGSFVNLLAKNNALRRPVPTLTTGRNDIEDPAFAMLLLVIASHRRMTYAQLSPFIEWAKLRTGGAYLNLPFLGDLLFTARLRAQRFVNPFAAEFFAQRILGKLGIPTAETQIVASREARSLAGDKWVLKFASRNRHLHAVNVEDLKNMFDLDGYCLASAVVPNAATVDYVRRKLLPNDTAEGLAAVIVRICNDLGRQYQKFAEFAEKILGKQYVAADDLYQNFLPSAAELANIREAIWWRGRQYLKLCAARVFLATSSPHAANVLVTRDGNLISIDHSTMKLEASGADLPTFFQHVNRNSTVFDLLGKIAALTEDDVCGVVDSIPKHPACGSTEELIPYFCDRLKLWKRLFAGESAPDRAVASSAV